jgi:Lar family restriction alleviation protein
MNDIAPKPRIRILVEQDTPVGVPCCPQAIAIFPCPFCGSKTPQAFDAGKQFIVTCPSCHAFGPLASEPEEAVKAWNRRPQ